MTVRTRSIALALALTLGACTGTSGGTLSAADRARLETLVQHVRRAAESLDPQGTQRALTDLKNAVTSYENTGNISSTRAAQILTAVAQVQSRLTLIPTTTTTATTTTTSSPPDGRGHGNKKNGKGNDNNGNG